MFVHVVTVSAVPAADLFQSTATGSGLFKLACYAVATAVVAFMLAKWLAQAKTFVAAAIALCAAAALMWGTEAVKSNTLDSTMTETWASVTSGGAAAKAPAQPAKPKG